ncbi:MAG: hypothetical protein HYW07_02340 [Candidatus Latescibacteria bacterium]|nr:hypothetical protein [Candidatus Latescibacterota bacterium]
MLTALVILLALVLALLLLPVLVAFEAEWPGPAGPVNFQLSWGFLMGGAGLQVRFQAEEWHLHPLVIGRRLAFPRLRLGGSQEGGAAEPLLPPQPEKEQAPPPLAKAPSGRAALGRLARESARPALRLLRRLGQTFHLRSLRLQGSFGLADPAATGQAFGYLQAVRALLRGRLRLELSPDFVRTGWRGKARLAIHLYFGKALFLLACFAARLAWRWWGLRKAARR